MPVASNPLQPVDVLHVILLGFVKYFWQDAVGKVKDGQKEMLIAHINSLDVSKLGLDTSTLVGKTLVQYAGSLVGRDFRIVIQVAPFILYDIVPQECYKSWLALAALAPLIWQPVISNLQDHVVSILVCL